MRLAAVAPSVLMFLLGCGPLVDDEQLAEEGEEVLLEAEGSLVSVTKTIIQYGTSVQGQPLNVFELVPSNASGRKAFLTFAVHGFEDAWKQDGRALFSIGQRMVNYYSTYPDKLNGWTLYLIATANPDGMRNGVNNFREGTAGAFGRCTSEGRDSNRNFATATFSEHDALKALVDSVRPTIVIDFHGWYNGYYGATRLGDYFANAFNAAYEGKPSGYCLVPTNGSMVCNSQVGGVFHKYTTIGQGLFAQWASAARGIPSVIVEYPAPDFNRNGVYDTVWDAELGYRRLNTTTLGLLSSRTRVALNNLFLTY